MSKKELTNMDIVLYTLYLLGGTKRKVFTEDIAIKCFEIAPSRFSWRKYPEYPDIEPARLTLKEAKNKRKLVVGRAGVVKGLKSSDGWIFTPNGVLWIGENLGRIRLILGESKPRALRTLTDKRWLERERSSAYKKFTKEGSCESVKDYEFTDLLDANLDTPPQLLKERLDEIKAQAAETKKEEFLSFLKQCEQRFANLLGRKNEK